MPNRPSRLVIASHRLPIVLFMEDGELKVIHGAGGLVTALKPVLTLRGGKWIGCPGTVPGARAEEVDRILAETRQESPFELIPVHLTEEQHRLYYEGASNSVIWPLFHDFLSLCDFDGRYFKAYEEVNRLFASTLASHTDEKDLIWVHDYQLMEVALHLKDMRLHRRCAFFLHIPFPSPDIYLKLPWRDRIIRALLEFHFIGFHTVREVRNFVQCVKIFEKDALVRRRGNWGTITLGSQRVSVGALPIGIDFRHFDRLSRHPAVRARAAEIKNNHRGRKIIFGVDRLDYTKGIPERLTAFELMLERHPEMLKNVTFLQLLVPSRETVREYAELRDRVERRISSINGRFSQDDWVPVIFMSRSMPQEELVAHYLAADVGLVTPRKDGMNLVSKEYCAAHSDLSGTLVLSEFAGAACQLQRGAILVNPNDREGVAEAIYQALVMPEGDKRRRMKILRHAVRRHDVFWWADSFFLAASGKHIKDFPTAGDPVVPSFHP
ncbi:alpha,alpha-trehalose-phosphate synthase (UDP-forming) [Thermanaerovibrio acidaminovorans]|uniref:alpha,alpha-trehalose-phosphate synthase (UDP-forming) n=1 Tax=Thermanaerovibrio acidaminovorans TaxID=81462 RepID=UPI002491E269|nr:trehalose-6-phosphate synthase [Thermanaerovibrio acidaminovorans]